MGAVFSLCVKYLDMAGDKSAFIGHFTASSPQHKTNPVDKTRSSKFDAPFRKRQNAYSGYNDGMETWLTKLDRRFCFLGGVCLTVLVMFLGMQTTLPVWAQATGGGQAGKQPVRVLSGGVKQQVGEGFRLEEITFYYKADAQARYLDLKNKWQQDHAGLVPADTLQQFAIDAWNKASVEKPFEVWLAQGGVSPKVFIAKAHVANNTDEARLGVRLTVTVKARIGDLRVDPTLLLTDYDYLAATARWQTLESKTVTIDALAPGEEMLVPLTQIEIMALQKRYVDQFPVEITVEAAMTGADNKRQQAKATLPLTPDHFVLPEY